MKEEIIERSGGRGERKRGKQDVVSIQCNDEGSKKRCRRNERNTCGRHTCVDISITWAAGAFGST